MVCTKGSSSMGMSVGPMVPGEVREGRLVVEAPSIRVEGRVVESGVEGSASPIAVLILLCVAPGGGWRKLLLLLLLLFYYFFFCINYGTG